MAVSNYRPSKKIIIKCCIESHVNEVGIIFNVLPQKKPYYYCLIINSIVVLIFLFLLTKLLFNISTLIIRSISPMLLIYI